MAHESSDMYIKGLKLHGKIPSFMHGGIRKRKVAQLCPDAPIANDFSDGGKKLIPSVFCHGNNVTSENYFGIAMILASHGYMVCSPNFMDGTPYYSKDQNDEYILWKRNPFEEKVNGELNP